MDTRCPVCSNVSPADVCPKCGEDLRKWREWDVCAERFASEGIACAENGRMHRALLALAKATFLQPDEPAVLKAMGDVLAAIEDYDMAAYYYDRCAAAPQAARTGLGAAAKTALAELETLRSQSLAAKVSPVTSLLKLEDMPRYSVPTPSLAPSAANSESGEQPETPRNLEGTVEQSVDPWKAVVALENDWQAAFSNLSALFSASGPNPGSAGPLHYLAGLLALSREDLPGAQHSFQQAVAADHSRRNAEIYLMVLSLSTGSLAEVVSFLRSSNRTDGDILKTLQETALVLVQREQTARAVKLLRDGLHEVPPAEASPIKAEIDSLLARLCPQEEVPQTTMAPGQAGTDSSPSGVAGDRRNGPVQSEPPPSPQT